MFSNEGFLTTRDGLRLYFRVRGDGPDVVLIPNGIVLVGDFEPLASGRTLIFYDVRNRGRSECSTDPAVLERGILNDVDDLDDVRRHFNAEGVAVIGHSYVGFTVAVCAKTYPRTVRRIVQIGALGPEPSKQYPPELSNVDATLRDVLAGLANLEKERATLPPVEFCKKFWSILAPIYVTDPADAHRIDRWSRCDEENERNAMSLLTQFIMPSIGRLNLTPPDFADVSTPALVVHGTKDRSAAYGGGVDWARTLPNARLLTVPGACHGPWIEAPDLVYGSIDAFLNGQWPETAVAV
jgi:pimeloyl-ACP methyl ester carboxylesterase